jgi:hypothetical protein
MDSGDNDSEYFPSDHTVARREPGPPPSEDEIDVLRHDLPG